MKTALNGLCNRDLLVLRGHEASALCVVWSADGTRLASCGADGTVRIWDAGTGKELQTLATHGGAVRQISWSPDGKRLASIGDDHTVRIWNLANGNVELQFAGGTRSVSWSPDGVRVAWDGPENAVVVCNIMSKQLRTLQNLTSPIETLAWSPDASHQLAVATVHRVYVWNDQMNSDVPWTIEAKDLDVSSLAWNKDGSLLATAGTVGLDATGHLRNAIAVWHTKWGVAMPWETPADDDNSSGHAGGVDAVAWNPKGDHLASASHLDWKIRVWDATGHPVSCFQGGGKAIFAIAWSPDGGRLAWAIDDGTIRIRYAVSHETPAILSGHTAHIDSASWNRNGTLIATGSVADGTVLVHNVLTGKAMPLRSFGSPAFSPVDDQLAVVSADHKVHLVDPVDGRNLRVIESPDALGNPTWSRDGQYLACTCAADQTVRIFAAATGMQTCAFPGATALAWSPDGRRIAAGAPGGRAIRITDIKSGLELMQLRAPGMCNLAWSLDGRLASGHDDGVIRIFDVTRGGGSPIQCSDHTAGIVSLSWSPDGSRLASTCRNEVTKIWNPVDGKALLSMRGYMQAVAWSPDSLSLACETKGHDIAILDASMGYAVEGSPRALSFLDRQIKRDPADAHLLQLRANIHVGMGP